MIVTTGNEVSERPIAKCPGLVTRHRRACPDDRAGTMNNTNLWDATWNTWLPFLALVGPLSLFLASLLLNMGVGVMPDKTYVNSSHEGFLMTLGAPFFVATFTFLGRTIAGRYLKVGILVTVLGILGAASLVFLSSMRLLQKAYIDSGFDSSTVWAAWDNVSVWHTPLLLQNVAAPLAFIIGGIALMRTTFAPKWVGLLMAICFPAIAAGQLLNAMSIAWTIGTALMTVAFWGLVRASQRDRSGA